MVLSSDLISEFVKATNDESSPKKEIIGYGTVVEQDGSLYVQLDGSTQVTPVTSTATLKAGDRVTVSIKNHTAIVTGNLSDPSASSAEAKEMGTKISEFDIIIADKVSTEDLDAERARIDDLTAENVTIKEQLTAASGSIDILESDYLTVKQKLTAAEADIGTLKSDKINTVVVEANYATIKSLDTTNLKVYNLEAAYGDFEILTTNKFTALDATIADLDAEKLSVGEADLKYANVDFSNITKAAMEYFYANSGLIEDVTIGDATITGRLSGVTISGNLIEADTIVAEKLVVKGEDGLYYRLNTDGETVSTKQTDYNSLNGKVLIAKSVTAEKVKVDDLVAFGATIGGFHIADHSLYSGAKESVDNTTTGLYLDDEGQMALGDSENYIKYHKDTTGAYKLDISAVNKSNDELREVISEERSSTIQDAQGIIMQALKSYVQKEDGVTVSSIVHYILRSAETEEGAVTHETSGWEEIRDWQDPNGSVGDGLWVYSEVTYSDGSIDTTKPVLIYTYVDQSVYIGDTLILYGANNDENATANESTVAFSLTIPELSAENRYLWCLIKVQLTNGTASFVQACRSHLIATYRYSYMELNNLVETQLKVLSDRITGSVTALNESIDSQVGDIQDQLRTITKYFTFDINGLTIGQTDSPYKITIDNDRYSMFVNETEVLWIDIETQEVHTPGITVTKKFNMLGYSVQEDSNGNLNWQYVGGE